MTLIKVEAWFNKLSEQEKDLPLLIFGGSAYSPRATLDEVKRGTPLGEQLQKLVERQSFGTTYQEEQRLAKIRCIITLQKKLLDKPLFATLSGKVFTPRQMIQEIETSTPIGRQQVEGELAHMKRLMKV